MSGSAKSGISVALRMAHDEKIEQAECRNDRASHRSMIFVCRTLGFMARRSSASSVTSGSVRDGFCCLRSSCSTRGDSSSAANVQKR